MGGAPPSQKLAFKEIKKVHQLQLDEAQALTARAGTVLSILIGALTAVLSISGVIARPPIWAIATPGILLVSGAVTSAWVFTGTEVTLGPNAASMKALVQQPDWETESDLIDFYEDAIKEDDSAIQGRRTLFRVSLGLLLATVVTLVGIALYLY